MSQLQFLRSAFLTDAASRSSISLSVVLTYLSRSSQTSLLVLQEFNAVIIRGLNRTTKNPITYSKLFNTKIIYSYALLRLLCFSFSEDGGLGLGRIPLLPPLPSPPSLTGRTSPLLSGLAT
jgi:hypothetical protein